MKKLLTFLFTFLVMALLVQAQAPDAIPYQGVARNLTGNILASQPISLRISIHDVLPTGTVVYSETHAVTTTSLGLFNINIGQGAIITGTLAGVNWGTGAKFIQVELDPSPPSSYIDMGTTQLNSVPYALYAGTFQSGTAAGQMLYWNGSAWVAIPPGAPGQALTYGSNGPVWQLSGTHTSITAPVSNIQDVTATCGGNILGSTTLVTARGVCWSTSPNPTTSNSFTTDGTGVGTFVSNLTGLTPLTTYYVRAYATSSVGTAYGNEISFTTIIPGVPALTTSPINSIMITDAISGGNIINDGVSLVTARGVCWSTSPNPTTSNSHTTDGTGIGTFVSNLSGLTLGTTYFVRAYATNSFGTAYGNEISFTTLILPTLTTSPINTISAGSAISGGNISNDGGTPVISRGVCWSTALLPTIANSKTVVGTGIGTFVSNITGLMSNTIYYVRAYATNIAGTFYGTSIGFTTLNTTVPSLTTSPISSISYNNAISGGSISNGGGAPVTARGVCWSTSSNPTTANSFTTDGSGVGTFISNLTGLTANTAYFARAYATNSLGTTYGNEISFTTLNTTLPNLTTSPINSIGFSTAISGGNITDGGGLPVTARGVCWSTLPNPTTANNFTTDGTGTGTFISNPTGLIPGTTYYARAYATNSLGTAYGNEISFTTFATAIGQPYQGGVLAYLLQPGDPGHDPNVPHGLIAAPSDQSTGSEWGCEGTLIPGADGTAVGTGNQNTIDIMAGCATAGIAARLCGDLTLGGYSDWYLPSKDELNLLYLNQVAIGGFVNYIYWSSSEFDSNYVWFQYFVNGTQSYTLKNTSYILVRAVRAF